MHSSILARLKAQMANLKKELQQVTAELGSGMAALASSF
jgi:hypothetical protein